jgi:hypothetical protein
MKTIAIMQPYFFPYIGYWQLINAVDRFVIYDDVNYIKGGWINRNRILINGAPAFLTAPLHKSSSHKHICDISLQTSSLWRDKLLKSVETTYRKSPYFHGVFPIIEAIIRHDTDNLADYLTHQLLKLSAFIGIKTEFVVSSHCYANNNLSSQTRILDICKQESANRYINPQGGQALYDTVSFHNIGVDLHFIVMHPITYKQRVKGFIPNLSIIDVLMENEPDKVRQQLDAFNLTAIT